MRLNPSELPIPVVENHLNISVTPRSWRSYREILGLETLDPRGLEILDIGSGVKHDSPDDLLAFPGANITACDINYGRGINPKYNTAHRVIPGDVMALPFEDNEFDMILSVMMLPHFRVSDVRRALSELARVCRPSGEIRTAPFLLGSDLPWLWIQQLEAEGYRFQNLGSGSEGQIVSITFC